MATEPAAGGDAGSTADTTVSATDENGIMDMDALTPDEGGGDIEDGELNVKDDDESAVDPAKETPDPAAKVEETADEDAKKKLSGAQRAKLREQRLLDDLEARDREIAELRTKAKAPAQDAGVDPNMPKEADFNGDYFAFTTAMTEYKAGIAAQKAIDERFKSREDADHAEREQKRQRAIDLDHAERVEAAKEVITDFDAAMEGMKSVNVRNDLIGLIKSDENSAVITYYLAKNPDKLAEINRLPPLQMAKEIGRLGAEQKLPEPKKATAAPLPLRKAGGSGPAPVNQERLLQQWMDKKYGKK